MASVLFIFYFFPDSLDAAPHPIKVKRMSWQKRRRKGSPADVNVFMLAGPGEGTAVTFLVDARKVVWKLLCRTLHLPL